MERDLPSGGHGRVCGARLKQQREDGRTTCENPRGFKTGHPGYGTCHLHNGKTPTGIAAAERERAEQALEQAQKTFGLPVDVEPAEALLALLATSAGAASWLTDQVRALPADKVVAGGKTHPLVALWLEERKEARTVAKTAHDAGLGDRMARLAEEQGQLAVRLIEGAVREFGRIALDRVLALLPAHERDAMAQRLAGVQLLDPLDEEVRAAIAGQLRLLRPAELDEREAS